MAVSQYKPFGASVNTSVVSQASYEAATWRLDGWRSGILPHQQINKVLRQSSVVAAAITQAMAETLAFDILDDGNVTNLANQFRGFFSVANLPYDPNTVYPPGSAGATLRALNDSGASWLTTERLKEVLTGSLAETELSISMRSRLNLIDTPGTGLVSRVADLQTAYGPTVSANLAADTATIASLAATEAYNMAALAQGAAFTSETNANTARTAAESARTSAETASTSASSSASSAGGSASTASTKATEAATAATTATNAATAATTKASEATASASDAATYAAAAEETLLEVTTAASDAYVSRLLAVGSANTATTAASTASEKADLAAASADSANSAASSATISATSAANSSNNASTKANEASTYASNAATSSANALTHAGNASSSASNAETASTLATTKATTATTAATAATTAATTATSQADTAASAANAASTSATNASTEASNAATSASSAASSATTATTQASNAASSSSNAAASSTNAAGSAATATTKALDAANSATSAQNSASAASGSASTASTQATSAGNSASAAQTAKTAAESSAALAQGSADDALSASASASTSASSASTSASNAAGSAASASTSATTAASASNAAGSSATAATTSASNASASASAAANSATAAADWYNQTVSATGTLSAAVTQEANTRAGQIAGVHAQLVFKTVATRSDGKKVLGAIGLASTAPNDATGGQSEILLQADRMVFVPSSDPNAPLKNLLEVGLVDGVATLRIPAALIGDAVIGNAKIAGDLNASKIVSGILNSNIVLAGQLSAVTGSLGTLQIAAGGHVRQGQTAFDTGTGFWLGDANGTPKFSVGSATKGISWDGSNFAVKGQVVGVGNLLSGAAASIGYAPFVGGTVLNGPYYGTPETPLGTQYRYAATTVISQTASDKALLVFTWDYSQIGVSGSRVFVEVIRSVNGGAEEIVWAHLVATTGSGRIGGVFPVSGQALSTGVSGSVAYSVRFKLMDYIQYVTLNQGSLAAILLKNAG